MKKTLTVMTLLAGATVAYSQGSISMNDYGGPFSIQVFQPQAPGVGTLVTVNGYSGYEVMGNPANSYLPVQGSAHYNAMSTIGSPGNPTSVGLLAVAGTTATSYSQLSLIPSSVSSLWLSGNTKDAVNNNAGIWNSGSSAAIGPGNPTTASIAIAAWQNNGSKGAATTLAAAQADGYNWGVSQIVTASLATGQTSPGFLPNTITSFSEVTTVPEPSTIALGVIGASTLLFRRRK